MQCEGDHRTPKPLVTYGVISLGIHYILFKDPMTTVAAIDRLMHHSAVLELNVPKRQEKEE